MAMAIDLHIHSKDCSDGSMHLDEIFREAKKRGITFMSISDHDSIGCQERAIQLARENEIGYVPGVELSVQFSHPDYRDGKSISLDFLGYGYDIRNTALEDKLEVIRNYREERAGKILQKLNQVFDEEGRERFTEEDLKEIQKTVDGSFGRPHIAKYLIRKGIVNGMQDAFDCYLVRCNVPKYPFKLEEASKLIRDAGGVLVFAHPNNNTGTSLVKYTEDLHEQSRIIENSMLDHIDGMECWHSRHDERTTAHYINFSDKHGLIKTGGSDCHQKPVIMGTLDIPEYVSKQFETSYIDS